MTQEIKKIRKIKKFIDKHLKESSKTKDQAIYVLRTLVMVHDMLDELELELKQ